MKNDEKKLRSFVNNIQRTGSLSSEAEESKSKLGKTKMQPRVPSIKPAFKNEGTDIPR